jgi:hypothetical protein
MGPVMGRPGYFGVEVSKERQTWRVVAAGYLPEVVTGQSGEGGGREAEIEVRLKRGGDLKGTVCDQKGRPALGVRLFLIEQANRLSLEDGKSQSPFVGSTVVTDVDGHFALSGVGGSGQELVVVSSAGFPVGFAPRVEPGQRLKITLPELGTLVVRYDIPGDVPRSSVRLQLMSPNLLDRNCGMFVRYLEVTNKGEVLVPGLTPGKYDLLLGKKLGGELGHFYCRSNVVVEAGQTQYANYVRATGFAVRGEAVLAGGRAAACALVRVRSAEATGEWGSAKEWMLPQFDIVKCDETGHFATARLEPGTYTIVAEMFAMDPPAPPWQEIVIINTAIREPEWIGTAKVTVNADTAPAPLRVSLIRAGTQ